MRRLARITGTLLMIGGIGTVGWALLVWQWQDPFTAAYTKWQQHQLAGQYHKLADSFRPTPSPPARADATATAPTAAALAAERRAIALDGRRYRAQLHEGDPIGKIKISRLGLNMLFVNGTKHDSLTKGPGRYVGSFMPGEGKLIYIAGHRTTYLAPFAHIDSLRKGDRVTLELPYATFEYTISGHRIVSASDLSVLKSPGHELLTLQACHPRFFASHRWLAFARLTKVVPKTGPAYETDGTQLLAAGR